MISAQKTEEQPQADSQDQNPGPDPPASPGPEKKRHPRHQGRDTSVEEQRSSSVALLERNCPKERDDKSPSKRDGDIGDTPVAAKDHQHSQRQFPFETRTSWGAHPFKRWGFSPLYQGAVGPVKKGPVPGGHCPPGAVFSRSPYTSACSSSTDAIWRSSPPVPPSAGPSLCRLPADTPASAPQAAPGAAGSESRTRGSPRSAR